MFDVVALGEILIDFLPNGKSERGNEIFESNPGGAPANVLALLALLGKNTAFIGKVGNDYFGKFLEKVLKNINIDTKGLVFSDTINTTLAFVNIDEKGERNFSFYRNPGADMMLEESEMEMDIIKNTRIFHFGTLSMTDEPSRTATLSAVNAAKENGAIISFDPNLRPALWNNLNFARKMMRKGMEYANILKVSADEMEFITGKLDFKEGSKIVFEEYKIPIILVTLGNEGCFFRLGEKSGHVKSYKVKTIDTTGAGDAFLGAFLYCILEAKKDISKLEMKDIEYMVEFSCAAGALTTTRRGAIPAMPSIEDINSCISNGIFL